jgi:uncharacterized protein (UPF0276 family)
MTPDAALPAEPIPACAGIGLRGQHYEDVLTLRPAVGFFEVHSENYFGLGGTPHRYLERIRADYALSFHGVGLSLGSTDPLSRPHLARLRELIEHYQPSLVSEHLSWSSVGGRYLNDLLPLPYTEEAATHIAEHVSQLQDSLGRRILVENVSCYLEFEHSGLTEWEFVNAVAETADCGILLDINNVYVNACNHGFDAKEFLRGISRQRVAEMHLAGHTENKFDGGSILIDTHNRRVCDSVWDLYRDAVEQLGPLPTLVEWDSDLPEMPVLVDEAGIAASILEQSRARVA